MADTTTTDAVPVSPDYMDNAPRIALSLATLQHPAFYILLGAFATIILIYAVKKGKL